ncbi:MAG: molybdopterin guanine dinucleotide synthesis [Pseudomonadota bacterium]
MKPFDTICVVDWSAGNDTGPTPRKDAIWAGVCRGETEEEPVYLRNRDSAVEWLSAFIASERAAGRRVLIGFDFPFGYPEGFSSAIVGVGSALKLWDFYAAHLRDSPRSNNRFHLAGEINACFPGVGPFWFNGLKEDIPHLPRTRKERDRGHGQTDRRVCESKARGTFTCWQMGGAGAVGGQVMTGMAALAGLRDRFKGDVWVWPFEAPYGPVLFVEVWPSLIAPAVKAAGDPIKDRAQVRLLARALARLPMDEFRGLFAVDAPNEGWILGVGHEDKLGAALCQS